MKEDLSAEVLKLREQGLGIAQIARALNKGNAYVTAVLKANAAYGQPYYLTDDEKASIKRLRLEGHSAEVIANSLGRSKYAVIEHLTKLKLNDRVIRDVVVKGDVAEITLTKGFIALIDAGDVALVQGKSWFRTGPKTHAYAASRFDGKITYLHRFLMQPPDDMVIDHINGQTLDNRRSNLRIATVKENGANVRRELGRTGFLGVQSTRTGTFFSVITLNLGTFDTAEDAARAYDKKAIELFGEFAMTNAKRGLLK